MTYSYLPNTWKLRSRAGSGLFRALTLSLLFAAIAWVPAVADPVVQITDCGTVISQPGHYILANNLNCGSPLPTAPILRNTSPTTPWQQMQNPFAGRAGQAPTDPPPPPFGILIAADHVDLALDGHTISSDFSGEFGIVVSPFAIPGNSHVHITGPGTVTGWLVGVTLFGSSFSSVTDVTADTNGGGFIDVAGLKNTFDGNTATNNGAIEEIFFGGISLLGSTDDAVRNNTVTGNLDGIIVVSFIVGPSTGNDVRFNTVTNNFGVGIGIQATDTSIFLNTATGTVDGFDVDDENTNCASNMWKHNSFGTANQPCIN